MSANVNAGELLRIMRVRLSCQLEGITNPPAAIKAATQALVDKLSRIDASEVIEVTASTPVLARYVRVSTGEVLAEIHTNENT